MFACYSLYVSTGRLVYGAVCGPRMPSRTSQVRGRRPQNCRWTKPQPLRSDRWTGSPDHEQCRQDLLCRELFLAHRVECINPPSQYIWQGDTYNLKSHRRCNNLSRMNLSGYVRHLTIFSWNAYHCMLFLSRVRVMIRVRIRFSVWLVICYAHVFVRG